MPNRVNFDGGGSVSPPVKPKNDYNKSSANTNQYYPHPKPVKKAKVKPVKVVARRPASTLGYSLGGSSGGGLSLGSGGGFPTPMMQSSADLRKLAAEAVDLDLVPQKDALNKNLHQEAVDYRDLVNKLRQQLGLTTGDLKQLYSALDVNLKVNAERQKQAFTTAKTSVGTDFDQLQTMLAQNYGNASSSTNAELNRLGINDPNATSQINTDKAFLSSTAATDKANAQSTLDQLGSSASSLASLLQGSAATAGTVQQGQVQTAYNENRASADKQHKGAVDDLKFQLNELMGSRPGKVNQTYQALLDQQYQRQMDAAQGAFDNNYKLAELGISQASLTADTAYKQNSLALDAKRLQSQLNQAAIKAGAPSTGLEKAETYLQNSWKSTSIPASELQRALIDIANGDTNTGGGRNLGAFDPRNMSEYAKDAASYVNQRGLPQQAYTTLINALHYLFGK